MVSPFCLAAACALRCFFNSMRRAVKRGDGRGREAVAQAPLLLLLRRVDEQSICFLAPLAALPLAYYIGLSFRSVIPGLYSRSRERGQACLDVRSPIAATAPFSRPSNVIRCHDRHVPRRPGSRRPGTQGHPKKGRSHHEPSAGTSSGPEKHGIPISRRTRLMKGDQ